MKRESHGLVAARRTVMPRAAVPHVRKGRSCRPSPAHGPGVMHILQQRDQTIAARRACPLRPTTSVAVSHRPARGRHRHVRRPTARPANSDPSATTVAVTQPNAKPPSCSTCRISGGRDEDTRRPGESLGQPLPATRFHSQREIQRGQVRSVQRCHGVFDDADDSRFRRFAVRTPRSAWRIVVTPHTLEG